MRFVITGEWTRPGLLRLVIVLFLVFVSLFWVTSALMYFQNMGLSYASVVSHYLGQPGPFGDPPVPRSYKVLLEVSHGHFFAMGILVMTLTHLLLFVPARDGLKVLLVLLSFGAALLGEVSGWLIRYVHPCFAYLKIGSFLVLQTALAMVIVLALLALRRGAAGRLAGRGGSCSTAT